MIANNPEWESEYEIQLSEHCEDDRSTSEADPRRFLEGSDCAGTARGAEYRRDDDHQRTVEPLQACAYAPEKGLLYFCGVFDWQIGVFQYVQSWHFG